MKKITKIRIGAVVIAIVHFLLSFFSAVLLLGWAFAESWGGNLEGATNLLMNILSVFALILYIPLGLLNIIFFAIGAPDWTQFIGLALNSILWGYIFYRIIKYFAFKKENKKE